LQYSYEHWANQPSDSKEQSDASVNHQVQSFPFVEELKELEETLSLGLDDGLEAYRQYQEARQSEQSETWEAVDETIPESDWDELAKLVADHVLSYVMDNPLQAELDKMRAQMDEYYRDNRVMAEQVQRLLDENDQLRRSMNACDLEISRYRHLVGNLFLKL
jgi:uncharacterized circularly permuted ATP-grasp superfamily protein